MIEPSPIPSALLDGARGQAKAYLRLDSTEEDGLIDQLVADAVSLAEAFTAQRLLIRTGVEQIPARSSWTRISTAPVRALALVEAVAGDGTAQAVAATSYQLDVTAEGDGWLRVTGSVPAARLRLTLSAGLAANWAALPDALRLGILRLTAHSYSHRDAAQDAGPPAAVAALLRPWRRMRLA